MDRQEGEIYLFKDNIKLQGYMKNDMVVELAKTRENAYDYISVDRTIVEATKKMLVNSKTNVRPRVVSVTPNPDYTLLLTFSNQERRILDMKIYLNKGIFKELKDIEYFMKVKVVLGSIKWSNGQDLCPDTLYNDGIPV